MDSVATQARSGRKKQEAATSEGAPERRYVDTATRYQSVYARHSLNCALGVGKKRCNCTPTYWGKVWDPAIGRARKTRFRRSISEAKNLREDLFAEVHSGAVTEKPKGIRFHKAHKLFIADCKAGVARNKQGKPYKAKAITDLDSSLKKVPDSIRQKLLAVITSGELQTAVDGFVRDGLSSSRIKSVISAVRSLYRWAAARDMATDSPAALVQLPANDSKERDRVATPGEFACLLAKLKTQDAPLCQRQVRRP